MGGRAAEQVKSDDITTRASNDIEKATSIARSMVTQYGMSSKIWHLDGLRDDSEPLSGWQTSA